MQWGLSACHCCHEKFLMSPKSQLPAKKNKFTFFTAQFLLDITVMLTDFLTHFTLWFYFLTRLFCLFWEIMDLLSASCFYLSWPNWIFSSFTSMVQHDLEIHSLHKVEYIHTKKCNACLSNANPAQFLHQVFLYMVLDYFQLLMSNSLLVLCIPIWDEMCSTVHLKKVDL